MSSSPFTAATRAARSHRRFHCALAALLDQRGGAACAAGCQSATAPLASKPPRGARSEADAAPLATSGRLPASCQKEGRRGEGSRGRRCQAAAEPSATGGAATGVGGCAKRTAGRDMRHREQMDSTPHPRQLPRIPRQHPPHRGRSWRGSWPRTATATRMTGAGPPVPLAPGLRRWRRDCQSHSVKQRRPRACHRLSSLA